MYQTIDVSGESESIQNDSSNAKITSLESRTQSQKRDTIKQADQSERAVFGNHREDIQNQPNDPSNRLRNRKGQLYST